jgi:hypothetical protein
MKMEKMEEIHNNHVNGNIRDFWAQVKRLSKRQLIEFLWYLTNDAQVKPNDAFTMCIKAFEDENRIDPTGY